MFAHIFLCVIFVTVFKDCFYEESNFYIDNFRKTVEILRKLTALENFHCPNSSGMVFRK